MEYLSDPVRLAQRALGVRVPLEDLLSEEKVIKSAENILASIIRDSKLPVVDGTLLDKALAFHASMAIAAATRNAIVMKRLADAIFEDALQQLERASEDELLRLARWLGLPLERGDEYLEWLVEPSGRVLKLLLQYSIPVERYLELVAPIDDATLHLSNSFLKKGLVYLDRSRLALLTSYAIKLKIVNKIEEYRNIENKVIREAAMRVLAILSTQRVRDRIRIETLPSCIRRVIENGAKTDEEVYTLLAFLHYIKPTPHDIEEILVRSGIAPLSAAENIAHALLAISTKTFTPYKCSSEPGRIACPEGCEGLLKEYYSNLNRRARAQRRSPGRRGSASHG
ncbi:MAG: hypothetical protein F7C35_02900 [Desulfurococcales archaeon]|nr:hypothetical protein [Desulfurococcales archaeon]